MKIRTIMGVSNLVDDNTYLNRHFIKAKDVIYLKLSNRNKGSEFNGRTGWCWVESLHAWNEIKGSNFVWRRS